ncbi:MAG: hypothetical protein [Olavius algarvensis Gamma 1 endosymbiont]|nr:MAG: hypothetical protein [Olavius algarvensis Gamma 1 endosymbiont]
MDTSNSITSLARNNDSILDPIQSSGTQHQACVSWLMATVSASYPNITD